MQRMIVEVNGRKITMEVSSQLDKSDRVEDKDVRKLGNSAVLLWPKGDRLGAEKLVYGMAGVAGGWTIVRFPVNQTQKFDEINDFAMTLRYCAL